MYHKLNTKHFLRQVIHRGKIVFSSCCYYQLFMKFIFKKIVNIIAYNNI